LEAFIAADDHHSYGGVSRHEPAEADAEERPTLHALQSLVNLRVLNSFDTINAFHVHLNSLNLVNQERLRPGWDTYFMVNLLPIGQLRLLIRWRLRLNSGLLRWHLFVRIA
jgi:dCMP deaminase